jgi:Uma2 family endonuclease
MGAVAQTKMTVEEYLAYDRAAEVKSEYHDGELFPNSVSMSVRHSRISANLVLYLGGLLRGTTCRVFNPTRVRVTPRKYFYPDVFVVCGHLKLTDEAQDTLTNPKVIFEVLSPSTADYDLGGKFLLYRSLDSLEEYIAVSQDEQKVHVYRRTPNDVWTLTTYEGLQASFRLDSIGITVPISEIYCELE